MMGHCQKASPSNENKLDGPLKRVPAISQVRKGEKGKMVRDRFKKLNREEKEDSISTGILEKFLDFPIKYLTKADF